MNKSLLSFLALLYIGSQSLIAQTQFGLSLSDGTLSTNNDSLCLRLNISFDAIGKLGSANLVLDYDQNSLGDPYIEAWPGLDTSLYLGEEIVPFQDGQSSFHFELASLNQGIDVPDGSLAILYLSRVCFDVLDPAGDLSVDWHENEAKGTVVYLADETTRLSPGILSGYEPPTSFPVEWLDFQVSQVETDIKLDWTTVQEINNDGFFVTRSTDGVVFEQLDFVPSLGNSATGHSYEWYDTEAIYEMSDQQILHYRLTQVDLAGTVTNSEIRTIQLSMTGMSFENVYPLPARAPGEMTVELKTSSDATIELALVNALGQIVTAFDYDFPDAGKHTVTYPLGDLPPGIYYLRFSEQEAVYHFVQVLIY